MHAYDRFLPEWFNRIRSRQLTLPRFQRSVAWDSKHVSDLLTTVLRGLPSGAALILARPSQDRGSFLGQRLRTLVLTRFVTR